MSVSVTATGGLMEFFAGDNGGGFQGSDIAVGTAAQPADIYHAGGASPVWSCATCAWGRPARR